jgi:hypothetical protein
MIGNELRHKAAAVPMNVAAATWILGGQLLDVLRDAEHGLDVVTELVRHDVRHREIAAGRTEARLQLVEEAEVEIHLLVGRAVERPGRR